VPSSRCGQFIATALAASILLIALWAEHADRHAPIVPWSPYLYMLLNSISFSLLVASLSLLITKRLIFSLAASAIVTAALAALSKTKYYYLQQKLLFSDFAYQLREVAEIKFFLQNYTLPATVAAATLLLVIGVAAAVYIADKSRVKRVVALPLLIASLALVEAAWQKVLPLDRDTVFAHAGANSRHLSNFLVSIRMFVVHANEPFSLGGNKTVSASPKIETHKSNPAVRPHIIVILHESSVDPAIYLEGNQYVVRSDFFTSGDEQRRRLNVKAYGGKTWISEHGLLLGADVSYFSSRKDFLGIVAAGKFKNSLPHELRSLGYRTVANYPSPTTFLNTGKFYQSLGFEKVFSEKEMNLEIKLGGARPRDLDYYKFMIEDLARNQKDLKEPEPSFYFLLTSATHYPWNYKEFPGVRDSEYIAGDDAVEYSRRQRIAADDLASFKASLAERFPGQPFIVAGFGDHHPLITHNYVHDWEMRNKRKRDPAEHMWRTYYHIGGINYSPNYQALSHEIEIGFLGESVLSAANLPLSGSYQIRRWLREKCGGRWADCSDLESLNAANAQLSDGPFAIFNK
jgi:phosphoglycerol transferase MdoB-like AlkP superfamily enzyme